MSLPGGLATVVVTGDFVDASGWPLTGRVTFTPTADLEDPTNSLSIPAVTRAYTLSRGQFTSDPLIATDNSTITPSGWAYTVTISLANLDPISYEILLPQATTPVDLSAITPVVAQSAVSAYLTLAGGTVTGPLTLTGGLRIPSGAAAGDYLASDSSGNAAWSGGPLGLSKGGTGSGSQNFTGLRAPLSSTLITANNYALAAGEFARFDTTSGALNANLPSSPADLSAIGVKLDKSAAPVNALTVTATGEIYFNAPDGGTSTVLTLSLLKQGVLLQYNASANSWDVHSDDLPLMQTDLRYRRSVSIAEYGALTSASDNGPAINAAITALGSAGGVIYVPPGTFTFSTALSLQSAKSVTFTGQTNPGAGAAMPSQLVWTGTGSGSAVNAQNSSGIVFRNLAILYNSSSFTGNLMDYRNVSGSDTSYGMLEHCYLGSSPSTVTSANALVNLDKCNDMTIRKCNIYGAVYGIYGKSSNASYSNAVLIQDCVFHGQSANHIYNAGQAWVIDHCTFESLSGGAAGAYAHDTGNYMDTVTFRGCWTGDGTGGTQFTVAGNSVSFLGNWIGATSGTCIYTDDVTNGLVIIGNDYVSASVALETMQPSGNSSSKGWVIFGNTYTSVTSKLSGNFAPGCVYHDGSAMNIYGLTVNGGFTLTSGDNIVTGTTTGTIIAAAASQKLGFWGTTAIVQPSATGTSTGFTANSGTAVQDASTFTGGVGSTAYRISDIVLALKSMGLLAQ